MAQKPGRNDPCPCGSGKKYKQCCLVKDDSASREARAKAAEAAEAAAPAEAEAAAGESPRQQKKHRRDQTAKPWKQNTQGHGLGKASLPRKVGGGG